MSPTPFSAKNMESRFLLLSNFIIDEAAKSNYSCVIVILPVFAKSDGTEQYNGHEQKPFHRPHKLKTKFVYILEMEKITQEFEDLKIIQTEFNLLTFPRITTVQ
ncbi:hypothetical protein ACFE04_021578 [Oxalis oulophora]